MTFQPHFTPVEMLQQGVFGGSYFHKAMDVDMEGLGQACLLALANRTPPDKRRNRYGVEAGQNYATWLLNGWIFPEDPLGWFHWYCRYHAGRRHERDAHQIRRWHHYLARWGRFARTQAATKGAPSNVVKQGLLQWAIDPAKVLAIGTPASDHDTWDDYMRVTAGAMEG